MGKRLEIIQVTRSRDYHRLSLEAGAADGFRPAQRLCESFGFMRCDQCGDYTPDPNSVFMTTLEL